MKPAVLRGVVRGRYGEVWVMLHAQEAGRVTKNGNEQAVPGRLC